MDLATASGQQPTLGFWLIIKLSQPTNQNTNRKGLSENYCFLMISFMVALALPRLRFQTSLNPGVALGLVLFIFASRSVFGFPTNQLSDPETILKRMAAPETRQSAVSDLEAAGPSLIVPFTWIYWNKEDKEMRLQAAEALLRLAFKNPDQLKPAVPVFTDLLKNSNGFLQAQAAQALGGMGFAAHSAIGPLVELITGGSSAAATTLVSIAEAVQDNALKMSRDELETAVRELESAREKILRAFPQNQATECEARVRRPTEYLNLRLQVENSTVRRAFFNFARRHFLWFAAAGVVLGIYALVVLLFWLYPVILVRTGPRETLLRKILCLHWLAGRERTQDAWVVRHIGKVKESLDERAGREDQHIRIAVPVKVNGSKPDPVGVEALQKIFTAHRVQLLIHGEGGVGKTNLAYQIARWAIHSDSRERLRRGHVLLPVFLRAGFRLSEVACQHPHSAVSDLFLRAIAQEIAALADLPLPPAIDWVGKLLVSGRILLIVDDIAEADSSLLSVLDVTGAGCHANALVVTSRNEHALRGAQSTTFEPVRLEGEGVDAFVSSYLETRNKSQFFPGTTLRDACRQLRGIATKRNVTVLMAKLYADLMVSRREPVRGHSDSPDDVPSSVPELMLQYLSYLNRGAADFKYPEDKEIHPAAKRVAWACLGRDFLPGSLDRLEAIEAIGGGAVASRWIEHMERRMRILKLDGLNRDRVRFSLDPLAEYLAGLFLAGDFRDARESWEAFFQNADRKRIVSQDISSFLSAVLDCCETERVRYGIPESIILRLRGLLGN